MHTKWSKVNYQKNGNKIFYFQNNRGRNRFLKIKQSQNKKEEGTLRRERVDSLLTEKGSWKLPTILNKC